MPDLSNDQIILALAVVGGVALLSLIGLIVALAKLRKARREYMVLRGEGSERDILAAVGRALRRIESIDGRIDALTEGQERQTAVTRFSLQRFGLVRFDAFEDMGGRMSFSAALLDDHGDGLLITSINGRTETRTYAKPVHRLSSPHNLSDEERAAIDVAASGEGRSVPAEVRTAAVTPSA